MKKDAKKESKKAAAKPTIASLQAEIKTITAKNEGMFNTGMELAAKNLAAEIKIEALKDENKHLKAGIQDVLAQLRILVLGEETNNKLNGESVSVLSETLNSMGRDLFEALTGKRG